MTIADVSHKYSNSHLKTLEYLNKEFNKQNKTLSVEQIKGICF